MDISYPTLSDIIGYNALALSAFPAKKADRAEVLSTTKISFAIESARECPGSRFDKGAMLLIGLVKAHAFASGNRRTAFIATTDFLARNGARLAVEDDPAMSGVLRGIREGAYSHSEISRWLEHGKIKTFKRE